MIGLRSESILRKLYKSHKELYLTMLEYGEISEHKSKIEPGKVSQVHTLKADARPVLVNEDNKIIYMFNITLNKGEGYKLKLSKYESR